VSCQQIKCHVNTPLGLVSAPA